MVFELIIKNRFEQDINVKVKQMGKDHVRLFYNDVAQYIFGINTKINIFKFKSFLEKSFLEKDVEKIIENFTKK